MNLRTLIFALLLAISSPAKDKKPKKAVIYVFKNCQTISQTQVVTADGKRHEELSCLCTQQRQKLDGKTGHLIVECQ